MRSRLFAVAPAAASLALAACAAVSPAVAGTGGQP